jgi:hypothetical protein
MAIESSSTMDVAFDSREQIFFYDMYSAYNTKNITPKTFREISTSDWMMLKNVNNATTEKVEVWKEQEKMKEEMKMAMQSRFRNG